ncbi:unnamed protein product [Allacma fusca]|uniref:Uncharacterized protein n=1 Tax=Allacma fusca TaxID=39272 RepID=A0A8J2KUL5_9HEXA|nr:unnamed protein product [Allacma fusca]
MAITASTHVRLSKVIEPLKVFTARSRSQGWIRGGKVYHVETASEASTLAAGFGESELAGLGWTSSPAPWPPSYDWYLVLAQLTCVRDRHVTFSCLPRLAHIVNDLTISQGHWRSHPVVPALASSSEPVVRKPWRERISPGIFTKVIRRRWVRVAAAAAILGALMGLVKRLVKAPPGPTRDDDLPNTTFRDGFPVPLVWDSPGLLTED